VNVLHLSILGRVCNGQSVDSSTGASPTMAGTFLTNKVGKGIMVVTPRTPCELYKRIAAAAFRA